MAVLAPYAGYIAYAVIAGTAIYSATRTVQVPGQTLSDMARQTAKEGEPRLIVYGVVRPIGGNVIAVQEPPRIERRKQKSGGKGGGGSKTTVEIPRRTYAIGICEGPVTGIRRAWRNSKLVYDARPDSQWGWRNNGTFLAKFKFYFGGWSQMPDPHLEAVFGVGEVPPMRGTCYMVARDEDLQDTAGAVPQWTFEVERAYGHALTSRPYSLEDLGSSGANTVAIKESPNVDLFEISGALSAVITGGSSGGSHRYTIEHDQVSGSGGLTSITKTRTTRYSSYTIEHDQVSGSGGLTSITKTRTSGQ